MAESSGPSSSGAGANFLDALWQEMFSAVFPTGVIKNGEGTDLTVTAPNSNMTVQVGIGRAIVQGLFYRNDANLTKTISAADPSLPRIDRVVLQATLSAPASVAVVIKTGTPNASPTAPSLTQNTSTWEISLAQVRVNATVTSLSNSNVTDERSYGGLNQTILPAAAAGAKIYVQSTLPGSANKYDVTIKLPFS